MKIEDFTEYTAKCFHGEPASCSFACPFHLDLRSFLKKAGDGKWTAAYKELTNAVVFPLLISKLCGQPCRERCQRSVTGDEAIAIRDIEAAVIKYAKSQKPVVYSIPPKIDTIAVVGAGVSGLSCALSLAQKNYPVTLFEEKAGWGGSLRNHPLYHEFDEEFTLLFSAVNVTLQFETKIKTLKELHDFDAVYIATGSGGDSFGLLETWDPECLTTSDAKVFMGGALCGASLIESIAQGRELSKSIEAFLQTGKTFAMKGGYDVSRYGHFFEHKGAKSVPIIKASSGDGYTEEEARGEAARCFLCDCSLCLDKCEMLKHFRKSPHKMAVEAYTDLQASVLSSRLITRETYSCSICGYCESICPEHVRIGEMLQLSRSTRLKGTYPAAFHDFWLREMDFHLSEAFFAFAPDGKKTCEFAFFPGCQLGASKPEYVYEAYTFLHRKFDMGIIHSCCGVPAFWAGDVTRLRANLDQITETWNNMGKPTLIFACATCESIFSKYLPKIGRISLYELLAEANEIEPVPLFQTAAVFDPCAAREKRGLEQGVRKLAAKAGIKLTELEEHNRCCGYGGHMQIANPSLYDEIVRNRTAAAEEPYLVYCVNCREVFASEGKRCAHILDVAFGLPPSDLPSLQEKRDNSLKLKKEFVKRMAESDFDPAAHPWDALELVANHELRHNMNKKLISDSDVKESIWLAETSGDKFLDEYNEISQCCMVKPVLTYWVQYRLIKPGTYEIFSVYTHRMRFSERE